MLERFLELRPAVDHVTARVERLSRLHLGLDDYDWYWVEELTEILSIFCEPTEDMSGQSYATIYSQYPYYSFLTRELQRLIKEYSGETPPADSGRGETPDTSNDTLLKAVTAGLTKLERYHRYADETSVAAISTILDPRCKLTSFTTMGWLKRDIEKARKSFYAVYDKQYAPGCGSRLDKALGTPRGGASNDEPAGKTSTMTRFQQSYLSQGSSSQPQRGSSGKRRKTSRATAPTDRASGRGAAGGPQGPRAEVEKYLAEDVEPYEVRKPPCLARLKLTWTRPGDGRCIPYYGGPVIPIASHALAAWPQIILLCRLPACRLSRCSLRPEI
jgi:hypothetical protein